MEDLVLEGSEFTPRVNFSLQNKSLTIEGKSLPEDAREFYRPLIEWTNSIEGQPVESLEVKLFLSYFNSSSSKQLLKLFYALEDLNESGIKSTIQWSYKSSDLMMKEKGEELNELIELPFELVAQ